MLIIGLILLTAGFIIIYQGTFAFNCSVFKYLFNLFSYIIIFSINPLEFKVLALIAFIIVSLFLYNNPQSMFVNPKSVYLVFNIKTHDLMDILRQVLTNQNINYHIANNSIMLDFPDKEIIVVKPKMLGLNILSLSAINNKEYHTLIENKLDIELNQLPRKKIPLFGSIVFSIGLITTVLFYISII